jgi:Bacterial PH domain
VLECVQMDYSQGILLYQDKPRYGLLLKIVLIVPVVLLGSGIYLWSTGDTFLSLPLLIEAFVIGLVFWFVFPREYQVYDNHLRIVLGKPFSLKVGFQNIETIRITSRFSFTINFATRIARSYVEIAVKKGMSIAITPTDGESFIDKANQALSQWAKTDAWLEYGVKPSR